MGELRIPETHHAYRAAHDIADAVVDAAVLPVLAERAQATGFERGSDINEIAHSVGALIERRPDLATPWSAVAQQEM